MFINLILPIILCFFPLIIYLIILTKFKLKITNQLITILIGILAILPISLIQYCLEAINLIKTYSLLYYFIKSMILFGFIEETLKATFILIIPRKENTLLQQILLATLMGLALASFENLIYFLETFNKASQRGAELIYTQIFKRICLTDVLHMSCAGISSIFIYTTRNKTIKSKWSYLLLAIILHGSYDFFAGFQNSLKLFAIPVVLLAAIECRIKYKAITTPIE